MSSDKSRLIKMILAATACGAFALALATPVTFDLGAQSLVAKAAYAKNGADDGDAPDDNGVDDGDAPDDNGSGGGGADDGAGHM